MKPLTIEQLKALEVGDWVWVIDKQTNRRKYRQLSFMWDDGELFGGTRFEFTSSRRQRGLHRHACNYGKTWLAYKNKEQAETKGEIVELPCKIGSLIWYINTYFDNGRLVHEMHNYVFKLNMLSEWGTRVFTDKSEAERRLAELKGE